LPAEPRFRDREEAGERLADHLSRVLPEAPSVVLGIPRGGVLVAKAVAARLGAPLDVVVPRKIGAPRNAELAVAALALGGEADILVRDEEALAYFGLGPEWLAAQAAIARAEIERRLRAYREDRPPVVLSGRRAIVVDDGLATGLTARAALGAVLREGPSEALVAVPVGAADTARAFRRDGLRVEACHLPAAFQSVGEFYSSFEAVDDDRVRAALSAR
jgi:predicted phosphoribosyltransferase